VIAFYPIWRDPTIVYPAMELLGAHKDVNHCLVTIVNVGKSVVTPRGKEGILNSEAVGEVE
jgi:hypothetical protein